MKKNAGDLKMSLKRARKLCVLERLWGTLHHRLVVDMRLAGITSIEEANAFLATYPDKHNEGFTVEPERKDSLKDTAKKTKKGREGENPYKTSS